MAWFVRCEDTRDLKDFMNEGKFAKNPKVKIDPEQLKMGIEVEMEHTSDRKIAEKIAKDHLSEWSPLPYYDYLKDMENNLKNIKNKQND